MGPSLTSESVDMRLARKAIVIPLTILIWAPVFGPSYYLLGSVRGGIIIGIAALSLIAAMVSLRFTKSVELTGNFVAAIIFIMLVALTTLTLGPGSPSLFWLPAVPIMALLISGVRSGIAWAVLSAFVLSCFLVQRLRRHNPAFQRNHGQQFSIAKLIGSRGNRPLRFQHDAGVQDQRANRRGKHWKSRELKVRQLIKPKVNFWPI